MLSNILGASQWYIILRARRVDITLLQAVSYYHVGLFFNNFLFGYVGGDAFRVYDINRKSGDMTSAMSTVILDRFVGFFMMTSMAMIAALFSIQELTTTKTVYFIAIILAIWMLGFVFIFNQRYAEGFANFFRPLLPQMIRENLRKIYMAMNEFRHNKRSLVQIFFISLLVQSLRIIVHYWAARAVGVNISLLYFFIFIPIIAMLASLPISVGGIGVREQAGVSLFSSLHILADKVIAFEFLAYIIGVVATIPGGIIFALRKNSAHRRVDDETV